MEPSDQLGQATLRCRALLRRDGHQRAGPGEWGELPMLLGVGPGQRYRPVGCRQRPLLRKDWRYPGQGERIQSLNYATYFAGSDGRISCCGQSFGAIQYWFSDGYSDYLRSFNWAMAAIPELAPDGQIICLVDVGGAEESPMAMIGSHIARSTPMRPKSSALLFGPSQSLRAVKPHRARRPQRPGLHHPAVWRGTFCPQDSSCPLRRRAGGRERCHHGYGRPRQHYPAHRLANGARARRVDPPARVSRPRPVPGEGLATH